jgi:polyisoprenoid-binding protein YceI
MAADARITGPTEAVAAQLALTGEWIADSAACIVSFAVPNFGVRTVTGRMPVNSASVIVGVDGRPVSVHAEIDASGVDTGNQRRDSDLRGPRFLAVERWPAITFESSEIRSADAGWTVDGTLIVKGTRSTIRLAVARLDTPASASPGCVDLNAAGRLDRRVAGVTRAPAFLVGRQVSLSLTVRLCPPTAG